jgi:tyrosyl-tRNA synthetase
MAFTDILHLAAQFTVARMLERDDFEKRYRAGEPISVHEFLYPLMQAYDSVVIRADIEIGATEQKFNLLAGRDIQMAYGVEPQVILTLPVLEGLDGVRRMSKSLGNYIGIAEPPKEIFGKVMSLPDTLVERYFRLVTDATPEECDAVARGLRSGDNPMHSKKELAHRLVRMYHGAEAAASARDEFERQFSRRELPRDIATLGIEAGTYRARDLMMRAFPGQYTGSQAGALFRQGAVHLNGERIADIGLEVRLGKGPGSIDEAIFKVGRRVARLVVGG